MQDFIKNHLQNNQKINTNGRNKIMVSKLS